MGARINAAWLLTSAVVFPSLLATAAKPWNYCVVDDTNGPAQWPKATGACDMVTQARHEEQSPIDLCSAIDMATLEPAVQSTRECLDFYYHDPASVDRNAKLTIRIGVCLCR
jgi:hypothetical protein